jgi:hypothetical protein
VYESVSARPPPVQKPCCEISQWRRSVSRLRAKVGCTLPVIGSTASAALSAL